MFKLLFVSIFMLVILHPYALMLNLKLMLLLLFLFLFLSGVYHRANFEEVAAAGGFMGEKYF